MDTYSKFVENDYKKGIRFLLNETRKSGIYIKKCNWVVGFSRYLSRSGLCYSFWRNVFDQGNLSRIEKCLNIEDIFHGRDTCLFIWHYTPQNVEVWERLEAKMHEDGYYNLETAQF